MKTLGITSIMKIKKTKEIKPVPVSIVYYKNKDKEVPVSSINQVEAKTLSIGDVFTFFNPRVILPSYYEVTDSSKYKSTCQPNCKVYKIN